ncbi:PorV/PorQ family protein [Candidatus Margulisiibacteriota bacterium]
MVKVRKIAIILTAALIALTMLATAAFSVDPMYIGVGARALGMGKAYVGVAEDADTVFMNPAGLGNIDKLKFSSMYTNFLEDVQYVVIGGAYPLDGEMGVIGGGIIATNVGGIPLTNQFGTFEANANYADNVMFVSYGIGLGEFSEDLKAFSVGGSLKYFSVGATGVSGEADGSGFGVDIGVLYEYTPYMQFGASIQNGINSGMDYPNTGEKGTIPSNLKLGTRVNIIGDKESGKAYYQGDNTLNGAVDYDFSMNEQMPSTLHLGLEYVLIEDLTLRAGIDQNPGAGEVQSNLTLGVGYDYDGMQFNYAYHPYGDIPGTATHFFSISYIGAEEKPVKAAPKPTTPLLTLVSPADKTITKNHIVKVAGVVREGSVVREVMVDGEPVAVKDNKFETVVPLTLGKNLVQVQATAILPQVQTETVSARLIRTIRFKDVNKDYWAAVPIEDAATIGLVNGYPDGTFRPARALSRAELSTLLVKAKGQGPGIASKSIFKDMKKNHWAAPYVKGAVTLGLVKGYPDKTFKPNNKINRAEGVMVLGRFDELKEPETLAYGPYPDLTANYWASKMIAAAKAEGLLEYMGEADFTPKKQLSRAEAVEMIVKTKLGRTKVDTLHDWTVGFVPGGSREIQMKQFADVMGSYWAAKPISYLGTVGIIGGYPDGTFRPEKALTRAELCTLLVKAKAISTPTNFVSSFKDLPSRHWAAPYVKSAVDLGLVTGYPDGKFMPNKKLSRAEAVAILARFDKLDVSKQLQYGPFPDMAAKHWSAKYIAAAKDSGILDYLKGQDFQPNRSVTRAEAAEMITKTKFGTMKIKEVFGRNVDLGEKTSAAPAGRGIPTQ